MLSTSVVVLDFETTGLSPRSDRITEVAALRIVGTRVVERYISLVNAGVRIPAHITSLTGITDEMIATAPRANDVVHALVDFIASDLVVAHNASFDYGFLSAECFKARILNRSFQMLCTMRLARRLLPGYSSYALSSVAGRLGVTRSGNAHRAESDARATADVLVALTRKVIDQYAVSDVDPHLLRRVTGWSTREVPSKLRRALSQPARADRPRYSAEGNEDVRDGAPNVRYRMYPAGNVRDEQTGQLYRRGDMVYLSSPVPSLVLSDPVRGEIRVPTRDIRGFNQEKVEARRTTNTPREPEPSPIKKFPTQVPWTSQPAPASPSAPWSPGRVETARWAAAVDSPPVGHRWWLDRDGDLHDRDHGSIYLKSRDAFRLVEQPRVGIVVSDPDVGEKFIPAGNIHGFEAYTRFVSSVERHTGVSVARSTGLHREAPKPWILDLETNTLRHRETGRQFKHGEYTRVTGAVSGYATRDPNHPWAGDLEIDIEWGT